MRRLPLLFALAALTAVVACSAVTWTSRIEDRGARLRQALQESIADPARREELQGQVDVMQNILLETVRAGEQRHREFVAASANPEATRDESYELFLVGLGFVETSD